MSQRSLTSAENVESMAFFVAIRLKLTFALRSLGARLDALTFDARRWLVPVPVVLVLAPVRATRRRPCASSR